MYNLNIQRPYESAKHNMIKQTETAESYFHNHR